MDLTPEQLAQSAALAYRDPSSPDPLEPQTIISQLQAEMPDFLEARPLLVDLLAFVERKAPEAEVRTAAEVLGARLKNQRFGA